MTHTIDGNSVSGNGDWRTSAIPPQPQSVRTGMFPGIAQRFPIRDVVMPGGLIVEGTLRASGASVTAAITALDPSRSSLAGGIVSTPRTEHALVRDRRRLPSISGFGGFFGVAV